MLSKPYQLLITILIGNMLVNIGATSFATLMSIRFWGESGVSIAIVLMTFLIVIFGEIAPKIYAVQQAEEMALKVAYPIRIFMKLFFPVRQVLKYIAGFFIVHLGGTTIFKTPYLTEKELQNLIKIGKKEGVVKESEEKMIYSVFEFGNTEVGEIMVPRVDMVAIEIDTPFEDIVKLMQEAKHARLPVYKKNLDDIAGIIYTKEYLLAGEGRDIKGLMKPAVFIPETKKIDELLREFQNKQLQMAIIVDEYGGTAGLITLEDILEEIVGELQDEFESKERLIEFLDDNKIILDGRLELYTVNQELHLNLPEGESDTLGGFIFSLFGRIPHEEEKINFKDVVFTVKKMGKKRVKKVILERKK